MSNIYTRGGDDGTTSRLGGGRIRKDDRLVEFLGTLDEANCAIGLARVVVEDEALDRVLEFLQHRLFNCSACTAVAAASLPTVTPEDTASLESAIDRLSGGSSSLCGFMLPGGDELTARLQLARTIVRRAERRAVALSDSEEIDLEILRFLNRASDLLFMAACASGEASRAPWLPDAERP